MLTPITLDTIPDLSLTARHAFALIAPEMALVEEECASQSSSDIPFINSLAGHLRASGGKRVRPALTILSNHAVGGDPTRCGLIRMAAVVEMLHTATLVHDDIIDNAETRRNRPSINSRFGNRAAVLMGDWLYMSAFETSLQERSLTVLDILTAVTRKMTEGELLQLEVKGRADIKESLYFDILQCKTAHLFSACCEIGAVLGGADATARRALRDYGMSLGTAFQLVDDLLDFTSSRETLGKAAGADLLEGNLTLSLIYLLESDPAMLDVLQAVMRERDYRAISRPELLRALEQHHALERAFARAREYAVAACADLEALPASPYRETLKALPAFVLSRDH